MVKQMHSFTSTQGEPLPNDIPFQSQSLRMKKGGVLGAGVRLIAKWHNESDHDCVRRRCTDSNITIQGITPPVYALRCKSALILKERSTQGCLFSEAHAANTREQSSWVNRQELLVRSSRHMRGLSIRPHATGFVLYRCDKIAPSAVLLPGAAPKSSRSWKCRAPSFGLKTFVIKQMMRCRRRLARVLDTQCSH